MGYLHAALDVNVAVFFPECKRDSEIQIEGATGCDAAVAAERCAGATHGNCLGILGEIHVACDRCRDGFGAEFHAEREGDGTAYRVIPSQAIAKGF